MIKKIDRIFFLTRYGYLVGRNNCLDDPQATQPRTAWHMLKKHAFCRERHLFAEGFMLTGPVGGIWGPKRLFTTPITKNFGLQGASEIVLGAKNLFIGCLTPVPLDRNLKTFFSFRFFSLSKNLFFWIWGNFGKIGRNFENPEQHQKLDIV